MHARAVGPSLRDRSFGSLCRGATAALCLCLSGCLLVPEDDFSGERTPNKRPMVRITGGVLSDSAQTTNRVRFYWFGADEDGVVRWFEWAVDDTISERAWRRTTQFSETIRLPAASLRADGSQGDWHTFYIRSVDDQYSRSEPDSRFFNARTIAPTSRIERPRPVDGARWAAALRMQWTGEDLDASNPDQLPEHFEIKLVANPGVDQTRLADVQRLFRDGPNLLVSPRAESYPTSGDYYERARRSWLRVPGVTREQWLQDMSVGASYGFAVRAIDEAGAVEQKFARHQNWVFFSVRNALITVVVYEPSMGSHRFDTPVFGEPWEVTIAPGQRFRLRWVADASASGTEPGPCNYGFDIPDPDDPSEPFRATDGQGGWIGWAPRSQMQDAISFPASGPKTHYFYLKVRDVSNRKDTETKCIVQINIAQFDFTKKFLVVDDQRRRPQSPHHSSPDDRTTDAWRQEILEGMADHLPAGESPGTYSVFPDEATSPSIRIPDDFLNTMGSYQTVIWDCAGGEQVGLEVAALDMLLSRYVGAGGNLLLYTWVGPVSKITRAFSERATAPIEPQPDDISAGQAWNRFGFMWQFLRLRGAVDKPRGEDLARDRRSLVRAVAADPAYPDIPLDYARWGGPSRGRGSHYYECLVPDPDEERLTPWYRREEGLDVTYTARCWTAINHNLNGKPIAWRTYATGEDRRQGLQRGKIVCFAFHPYYFDVTATRGAMTRSLLWLSQSP